jgi:hypothetical protein
MSLLSSIEVRQMLKGLEQGCTWGYIFWATRDPRLAWLARIHSECGDTNKRLKANRTDRFRLLKLAGVWISGTENLREESMRYT